MRQYFNYDKGTRAIFRSYYSIEQWENMVYDELKSNRPVPYAGQSGSGGHLTSSLRTPKIFIKEFGDFLMSCHQHCLGVNLLVQR